MWRFCSLWLVRWKWCLFANVLCDISILAHKLNSQLWMETWVRYSAISTWSHDNSYVFYVKCGAIKRTFTYVFTGTKTYNADVFSASKRTNTYVFSAFKRWKLTYWLHLKMNPYEYCGINFIISCHINYLVFSCLPVYLIWNDNISFCCVISASSFPRICLHNVKQDFTLKPQNK